MANLFDLLQAPADGRIQKPCNPLYPLDEDDLAMAGFLLLMGHGEGISSEKKIDLGKVPKIPSTSYPDLQKLRNDSRKKFDEACKKVFDHTFDTSSYPTINLTKMTCDLLKEAANKEEKEIIIKTYCCPKENCAMNLFCEAVAMTWMEKE
jgi:hypothetical protein